MPTVPRYNGEQVQQAPLPGVRYNVQTTPRDFGAGIAEGLGRAGEVAAQIYQDERAKADQVAAMDAERQLGDWENSTLYDAEKGALTRRGRDAFGLPEQVLGDYDSLVGKISAGLGSERQRMAFARAAQARRADIDRTVQRHVAGERRHYEQERFTSFMGTSQEAAWFNFMDPKRINLELQRQQGAIIDHAARNGMPAEWVQAQVAQAASATHTGVINRLLSAGQDQAATAYYQQHKTDIAGDVAGKLDAALAEASFRGNAQRQTAAIVAQHQDLGTAVEAARQIEDSKLQDDVVRRVRDFFALQQAARTEAADALYLDMNRELERNGGDLDAVRQARPSAFVDDLAPGQRQALELRARQIREGREPETDPKTYLRWMAMSPDELGRMSEAQIAQYQTKLAPDDWRRMVADWRNLRAAAAAGAGGGGGESSAARTSLLTFKDVVEGAMRSTGILPEGMTLTQLNKDEARRVVEFEQAAARAVELFEQNDLGGKRKASQAELQKIVNDLGVQAMRLETRAKVERNLMWDKSTTVSELTPEQAGKAYIPIGDIPAAMRLRMKAEAKRLGNPNVSDEQIQRAYLHYLRGDIDAHDRVLGPGVTIERGAGVNNQPTWYGSDE